MEKGKLIEFRHQGDRRLAVVDRPDGKKDWIVVDQGGLSHKIRPQRIEYEVPGGPYQPQDIPGFLAAVSTYLDPESLEVAWEFFVEEGKNITPQDLAELLFSATEPVFCYTAHCLLSEDRIYFKNKGDTYEPRSLAQVEEIKHQQAVELQRQQEREGFIVRLQQALTGENVTWTDSDRPRIESLEKLVLQPELSHRPALELLQTLERPQTPEAALTLLIELGWWNRHENLFLRRSSYPRQFSRKVLDLAYSLLDATIPDPDRQRLDLLSLKVYTIDDESTEEIDDGLSVEFLGEDNYRLWVHIADPSRLVSPNDELDLEARKRSTTLYLPTGMISMFPTELATGPMSLVQGQICPALSFGITLSSAGEVLDYRIHASFIKPTYRLTYEDVDE
ncbi:MAG: ribonuclease catalytic domain-containing protein, partial [Microcystaceae cyanobacterium]